MPLKNGALQARRRRAESRKPAYIDTVPNCFRIKKTHNTAPENKIRAGWRAPARPLSAESHDALFQGLIQIRQDIVDMLDAHGKPYQVGRDARRRLILCRELGMGGAGRVDGQALGVADIGQM